MNTESEAYEEKAMSLSSPRRTNATPAISAVTGNGKVSETHKYIIKRNKVNTLLPVAGRVVANTKSRM